MVYVPSLTGLASFNAVPVVCHDIGRAVRVWGFVLSEEATEVAAESAAAPKDLMGVGPQIQSESCPWLLGLCDDKFTRAPDVRRVRGDVHHACETIVRGQGGQGDRQDVVSEVTATEDVVGVCSARPKSWGGLPGPGGGGGRRLRGAWVEVAQGPDW